ncbi:hypothetical protein D3C84_985490 [compost metagenome]
MNEGAAALFLEFRGCSTAYVEGAFQVHEDHRVELFFAHPVEDHVAQVSGIVDHDVDAAEVLAGGVDHGLSLGEIGDRGGVGKGLPAHRLDFIDHCVSRSLSGGIAIQGHAEVIDHHFGTGRRQCQGNAAADTAACACD